MKNLKTSIILERAEEFLQQKIKTTHMPMREVKPLLFLLCFKGRPYLIIGYKFKACFLTITIILILDSTHTHTHIFKAIRVQLNKNK